MKSDFIELPASVDNFISYPKYKWFPFFFKEYEIERYSFKIYLLKDQVTRVDQVINHNYELEADKSRISSMSNEPIIVDLSPKKVLKLLRMTNTVKDDVGFKLK